MSVSTDLSSGSTDSYIFSFEATSGTDGNDSSAICARLDSFSWIAMTLKIANTHTYIYIFILFEKSRGVLVLESVRFMISAFIYLKVKCLNSPNIIDSIISSFNKHKQRNTHVMFISTYALGLIYIHYNRVRAQWQKIPLQIILNMKINIYMGKETPVNQQKIHTHVDVNDMEWLSSWLKVKAITN